MRYIVKITNNKTNEKSVHTQALIDGSWSNFHNDIRVFITHKNRMGWKLKDCNYTFEPYTEKRDLESSAWVNGLTIEQELKRINELKNECWL